MDYEDIKKQCLDFFDRTLSPCDISLCNGALEYLITIPSEYFFLEDSDFIVSDVECESCKRMERIFSVNNDMSYNLARVMMLIRRLIENEKTLELKEKGLSRDYHLNVFPINVPRGSLGMRYGNVPNSTPDNIFVFFNSKKEVWRVRDHIFAGG